MSLILEALKKSEANRRLGAAPDLATPFSPTRPARRSLPWLLVAIVAAAALGWWWLRPAPPKAVVTPAPVAAVPASTPPLTRRASPAAATQRVARAPELPPAMRPVQPMSQSPVAAPRGNVERGAAQERRRELLASRYGGEPLHMAAAPANAPPPATSNAVARAPKTATTRGYTAPAAPPSAAEPVAPRATPTATPPVPNQSAAQAAIPAATTAAPPVAATPPATADTPEVTPYYALAFALRKALPQLKLSMHVYSVDPKQRFVILNDARMVEGDTTPDGIQLHQIQPDGVILDFKGQRFFYPRDGM